MDELELLETYCAWCQGTGKMNGGSFDENGDVIKVDCVECG